MAAAAVRCIACAGVLAAGLLVGGFGGGIAIADPSDSASSGPDGAGDETATDEKPTTTVGSDSENTDEPAAKTFKSSLSIPILRWPKPEEVHETGVSAFVATVDIPVPEVDVFAALRQPDPEPTPTLRTQEETPVVDAGGGGGDTLSATTDEPPVLQAPLVAAPLPAAGPPSLSVVSVGASAGGPPAQSVGAARANAPLPRGTPQPTTEPASSSRPLRR